MTASERAKLPDSAFAYVDARGRRRLPINDEARVRNALARFEQVRFEDEEARERARRRLLNAAKRFGIVPVGFMTGQIAVERAQASGERVPLPTGFLTLLMTDIEGSTVLLRRLGDRYGGVLDEVRAILRRSVEVHGGYVIDVRADELFAVFEEAGAAVRAALEMQRELAARRWADDVAVRVRTGLHSGRPELTDSGYIGLAVHTTARVSAFAAGGQIVATDGARAAAEQTAPDGMRFHALGEHRLRGLPEAVALFEVGTPSG
jgi:class 3 adenylate cyclase